MSYTSAQKKSLEQDLGLPAAIVDILWARGLYTQHDIEHFFKPDYRFENHETSHGLQSGIKSIHKAVRKKSKILVYSDCTSSAFFASVALYRSLALQTPQIDFFVPDRNHHGYGINVETLKNCDSTADLIIFIGCNFLSEQDLQQSLSLNQADFIGIHSRHISTEEQRLLQLTDSQSSTAIKVLQLIESLSDEPKLSDILQFLSLSLIAEHHQLAEIERHIIQHSVKLSAKEVNVSISSMLSTKSNSEFEKWRKVITVINSALAQSKQSDLMNCFLVNVSDDAIAKKLFHLHKQRWNRIEESTDAISNQRNALELDHLKVIEADLVQSKDLSAITVRLSDQLDTNIFTYASDKGSLDCRFKAVNHVDVSKLISDYDSQIKIHGFKHNISFKIAVEQKDDLISYLNNQLAKHDRFFYDALIELSDINKRFYRLIKLMEPYDVINHEPVLASQNLKLNSQPELLKNKHIKFQVKQGKNICDAIAFNSADYYDWMLSQQNNFTMSFTLNEVIWRGIKTLQLNVKGFKRD